MSETNHQTPSAEQAAPNNTTLEKVYDPKTVEATWYDVWEKAGYFKPDPEKTRAYTIVVPPPNVTGSLHMGHALNSTLQDILIRYRKMQGDSALWVPGTDHGGIATQNVVEKMLKQEGTNRHALGREKFLERMWAWRQATGDTILNQFKRLGTALDWSRSRFTMDEVCSRAVRKAFVELYNKKLLYRGKRLVNWCPRCSTALADVEVEHNDVKGALWHIRYPIVDRRKKTRSAKAKATPDSVFSKGYIVVATTRPETMLGDTGVAVHPKDKRYKGVIGSAIKLPLMSREIPIVADDAVDQTFGSGAVKVTPAHDPVDFEIAGRTGLPHITVIGFDGKMTAEAGPYAGLDRFDARKKVVEDLEAQGLLEKIEDHKLAVSVCYRCETIIEPLESEQWFLAMKAMAKMGIEANKKKKVRIVPNSWESPYQLWLRNLKDWSVSRQIWWGHRIPVWYCKEKQNGSACPPIVSLIDPTECPVCRSRKIEQDPDVLDTWFSSALWPFSVFGWPDQTDDLKKFFPTATMVTGHEILYLWVARMIMFSLDFLGKVPFTTVLIHGIVRDKKGRKMSKSLGNVIDPLELINEFGADAVRLSLAQSATPGRDMQISKENFVKTRNFSNKVWNAARFSLMYMGECKIISAPGEWTAHLELSDRWILHRYNEVVRNATQAIDRFDMDSAARDLYDFFWSEFCDWYVEMAKPRLASLRQGDPNGNHSGLPVFSKESSEAARCVLATVLEGSLRLLHPFMPFITEEIWQKIPKPVGTTAAHLMGASWPVPIKEFGDLKAAREMETIKEVVTKLRAIRSEMGIPPTQAIDVLMKPSKPLTEKLVQGQAYVLKSLNSRVGRLTIDSKAARPNASAAAVIPGADFYVPLEGLIDFEKEKARLEKELAQLKEDVERLSKKLANQDFISHAPEEEVLKTKERLRESQERSLRLQDNISTLSH